MFKLSKEKMDEYKENIRDHVKENYPATIMVDLKTDMNSIHYHMRMLRETEEYLHRLEQDFGIHTRELELAEKRVHNALELLENIRAEKAYTEAMNDDSGYWLVARFDNEGFVRRYFEKPFDKSEEMREQQKIAMQLELEKKKVI